MAYCSKCGEQLSDENKACPKCGEQAAESNDEKQTQSATDKVNAAWAQINDTSDHTAAYDKNDVENNKFMSVLAYIWILFLIPLFMAKKSKYARFHVNQGLVLFVCEIILALLSYVPIIQYFVFILDIVLFVFVIMGIVNACTGKAKELPLVGGIKLIK